MKKFITVVLFVIFSAVSSHQSYAVVGDIPDEITLLCESFHFIEERCKRCVNFLKNGISRCAPLAPSKKVLAISACALVLATLVMPANGDIVILDTHGFVEVMQEKCASLLNLDTMSRTEHQLAESCYHSKSEEFFDEFGSECYLPSDPLFWENVRSYLTMQINKVITE